MKIITILIGNSDNKLTQSGWSHFAALMHHEVGKHVRTIHFRGGSDWDSPWQNACWVCEVLPEQLDPLRNAVLQVRKSYHQDSVAIIVGDTEFI